MTVKTFRDFVNDSTAKKVEVINLTQGPEDQIDPEAENRPLYGPNGNLHLLMTNFGEDGEIPEARVKVYDTSGYLGSRIGEVGQTHQVSPWIRPAERDAWIESQH